MSIGAMNAGICTQAREIMDTFEKANYINTHTTFLPGSYDKRFIRSVSSMNPDLLTKKQIDLIERMWHRYRRQNRLHNMSNCLVCRGILSDKRLILTEDDIQREKLEAWKKAVND
jgi:hypothetical protein